MKACKYTQQLHKCIGAATVSGLFPVLHCLTMQLKTSCYTLWLMAYGLWLMAYGLWLMAYGLWLMAYQHFKDKKKQESLHFPASDYL